MRIKADHPATKKARRKSPSDSTSNTMRIETREPGCEGCRQDRLLMIHPLERGLKPHEQYYRIHFYFMNNYDAFNILTSSKTSLISFISFAEKFDNNPLGATKTVKSVRARAITLFLFSLTLTLKNS